MKLIDLTNKKFGKLLVLGRDIEYQKLKKADKPYWKCQCDCGNIVTVLGKSLREGHTKSCGCLQKDIIKQLNFQDLTGQTFGKLTVLQYMDNSKWLCRCSCGNTTIIQTCHLKDGHTNSCGCLHSKGELFISQFLNNNKIHFKKEYTCDDLKNNQGNKLRIDFAILDNHNNPTLFIEYNGKQHYDIQDAWYSSKMQLHDKIKIEYAKNKNIPLIIIKYDDNLEFVMSRIDFSKYNNT